jgi:trk system potassium uptake protein TrkA
MRVIIVGCGQLGSTLAYQFYKMGHQVTVIDQATSAFDNLSLDFRGRTIEGDVLARNVLHRAEIEDADALAAVTYSDSLNALVAHVARTEFQVPRVVARNCDPRQRPLQEAFGIPIVGSANWGAQRIIGLLSDTPLRTMLVDRKANLVIYQLEVPETWQGRPLQELLPDERSQVLALTRAGQPLEVSRTQPLETGDLIYLSAASGEIEALRHRLELQQEQLS